MTPYHVFAEAVNKNPKLTFRDAWFDFEAWERARGFRDDPGAPSKNALDWVRDLYGLTVTLEEFNGAGKQNCLDALEAAFVAFARLDHAPELCSAVQRWRRRRETESDTSVGMEV